LTTAELLQREWERGKWPSPLFSVFGVFNHLFRIDWLHCADQGVAPDYLGNLFKHAVDNKRVPGASKAKRCKFIGERIWEFYDDPAAHVLDKLKGFAEKSFSSEKKRKLPPKMKGNAASMRALVPFGKRFAQQFLDEADEKEGAIIEAGKHLSNCYDALSMANQAFAKDALYESSKRFALLYGALHKASGGKAAWRPMPKMHMFLELCMEGTEPNKFWCYRDEDFGGSFSRQSRMKGSWKKLSTFSKHALDLFRIKNAAPRLCKVTQSHFDKQDSLHACIHARLHNHASMHACTLALPTDTYVQP
jgi:hypothetical protein